MVQRPMTEASPERLLEIQTPGSLLRLSVLESLGEGPKSLCSNSLPGASAPSPTYTLLCT